MKVAINFLPFGTFVNAGTNALAYFPPPSSPTKKSFITWTKYFEQKKLTEKKKKNEPFLSPS